MISTLWKPDSAQGRDDIRSKHLGLPTLPFCPKLPPIRPRFPTYLAAPRSGLCWGIGGPEASADLAKAHVRSRSKNLLDFEKNGAAKLGVGALTMGSQCELQLHIDVPASHLTSEICGHQLPVAIITEVLDPDSMSYCDLPRSLLQRLDTLRR